MKAISRKSFALIAVAMIGLASGAAHGQAWIGQMVGDMIARQQAAVQEQACMTGAPMPDSEVAETRATALAAMSGYWGAVSVGGTANVAPYYQIDKKAKWVSGSTIVPLAGLSRVTDPFAVGGATLDTNPLAFFRAGDGSTVRGQWAVRRSDGGLVGTYDAGFRRAAGAWKLVDLTLIPATSYVEPLVQYCHKAGDVLPYRVSWTTSQRSYLEARATKLEAKAVKAQAAANKAVGASESAALTRKRAADAATKAKGAREEARLAGEANDRALADAKAVDAARVAGQAALTR